MSSYMFTPCETAYNVVFQNVVSQEGCNSFDIGRFSRESIYSCVKPGDALLFKRRHFIHSALCISTWPHLIVHNPGNRDPDTDEGIEIGTMSDLLDGINPTHVLKIDYATNKWRMPISIADALSHVRRRGYHLLYNSCQTFAIGSLLMCKSVISIEALIRFERFLKLGLSILTPLLVVLVAAVASRFATPVMTLMLAAGSARIALWMVKRLDDYLRSDSFRTHWYPRRYANSELIRDIDSVTDIARDAITGRSETSMKKLEGLKLKMMHLFARWPYDRDDNGMIVFENEETDKNNRLWATELDDIQFKIFYCIIKNYSLYEILKTGWDGPLDEKAISGLRIISNYLNQPYFRCMDFTFTKNAIINECFKPMLKNLFATICKLSYDDLEKIGEADLVMQKIPTLSADDRERLRQLKPETVRLAESNNPWEMLRGHIK